MADWILMDKTYYEKILYRRSVLQAHEKDVIGFNPVARDAVYELYSYIFGTYLPSRFPSMFALCGSGKSAQKYTRNLVFGEDIPLCPLPSTPQECLRALGNHIDCDFTILVPESNPNADPRMAVPTTEPTEAYHLHAFAVLFPSGFNTPGKLGLPLAGSCLVCLN
jgi:Protein of unknown function (DUF3445)